MKLRGLLAAAASICLLGALGACSALGGGNSPAPRDPTAGITNSQNVDAFSLHVGDCLISADLDTTFSNVPGVPCTEAHDSEVIYIFDVTDATYDEDTINSEADTQCQQAITDYVGPNYASVGSEGLDYTWFNPTQDSWNSGDREIDCVAMTNASTNDLTSSVKGLGK